MPPTSTKQPQTKFYREDIVRRVNDHSILGVVLRCWHDEEDLPLPEQILDPLLRPLKRGEVGVSFLPTQKREILSEAEFELVDRPFQVGDVCKRRIDDVQSAAVTAVDVQFKVSHVISGVKVDSWLNEEAVESFGDIAMGETVAYGDWIGQVQEMFDETVIQVSDGGLLRLPELNSRLTVGDRGLDILPPPIPGSTHHLDAIHPSENDTVLAIRHTVLAISWMAVNQKLSPSVAASRKRPQRMWHGDDLKKLTLIRGPDSHVVRTGDKITLKNPPGDLITRYGSESGNGPIVVDKFLVSESNTTVTLLWQDGKVEKVASRELIPYLNPDEYDCWPGDNVLWKTEDAKHPAIVQSVSAVERTAEIVLYDGKRELVSVLELDPHGPQASSENPHEAFGVRRAELVFIHAEGSTNGCDRPVVPVIGELEGWALEAPFVNEVGDFTGWRKELDMLGQQIALSDDPASVSYVATTMKNGANEIDWFGEVLNLRLDGLVDIALANGAKVSLPLERLSRLNDGLEQIEDAWGDELAEHTHMGEDVGRILEYQTEDGEWHKYEAEDAEENDWVDDDGDDEMDIEEIVDDIEMVVEGRNELAHENGIVGDAAKHMEVASNAAVGDGGELGSTSTIPTLAQGISSDQVDGPWKRFEVLTEAPLDHAFYSTPPVQPSRQFLARLSKEYRALMSSLPESVIVRTYEDRTDLLRSLIIGPENTPYEDAPFVIDWMLDANFPQTPPIAHFLSWTNGNGRVNPNLYEEGKVCLSILGTWAGDRNESWSAARSSLLQALVSIQGLVLVKEPWYCEPAYEKWRGSDEGKVNSRLYNEKAYVLSRGFVRRALEIPLGDLKDVIIEIYRTQGRLRTVIEKANALIAKSKDIPEDAGSNDDDLAVSRLTQGGIIALSRTMVKLEELLTSNADASS